VSISESDLSAEAFDLIIVGTGSGNSIPSFLDDWKIAIVERDVFGGTCLNRGCIPSKMFVYPADVAVAADSSAKLGIDTQFNGADWSAIRDRVFGLIDPIASSGRDFRATGSPNVTLIEGLQSMSGALMDRIVQSSSEKILKAQRISSTSTSSTWKVARSPLPTSCSPLVPDRSCHRSRV